MMTIKEARSMNLSDQNIDKAYWVYDPHTKEVRDNNIFSDYAIVLAPKRGLKNDMESVRENENLRNRAANGRVAYAYRVQVGKGYSLVYTNIEHAARIIGCDTDTAVDWIKRLYDREQPEPIVRNGISFKIYLTNIDE